MDTCSPPDWKAAMNGALGSRLSWEPLVLNQQKCKHMCKVVKALKKFGMFLKIILYSIVICFSVTLPVTLSMGSHRLSEVPTPMDDEAYAYSWTYYIKY